MAAESTRKITRYATVAAAVAITGLVSLGLSIAFAQFDSSLTERLNGLFETRLPDNQSSAVVLALSANGLAILALSLVACLAGTLSSVPRLIACLQLFVISLMADWAMLASSMQPRPIGFFMAIIFGCASGYLIRTQQLERARKQSSSSELMLRTRELQEARLQMVKQDETDRRLLAADLHDQVLNDLKILNQKIRSQREQVDVDESAAIDNLLQQTMNGVRDVMDNLSPASLEHLGFGAALEDCLRRASERSGGFKVRFKNNFGESDFSELNLIEQTLLYRLVQECGTNISKHAGATIVKLALERVENDLLIRITDNGKGMPVGADLSASRGVQYMRQRGDLIGATIAWLPGDQNKGTAVEIRMPIVGQL